MLVSGPSLVGAQVERDTVDVLFVGNSYIYFNDLPSQLEALSTVIPTGPVLRSVQHTHGGFSLMRHLEDGHLPAVLAQESWDVVILQEQSTLGTAYADTTRGILGNPGLFHSAAREVVDQVREIGVEPWFYMTWAKKTYPDQIGALSDAYTSIGNELSASVIPAGLAWEQVGRERPDLELFTADGSHPSPIESYLVASVMYAALTGGDLSGAPSTSIEQSRQDGSRSVVALDEADAVYLRAVAMGVIQAFQSQ